MSEQPKVKDCIAIDPGTEQSGLVWIYGGKIVEAKVVANEDVISFLCLGFANGVKDLVIEKIEGMGLPVGVETFRTVWWTGRFHQSWPGDAHYITRREVKLYLCGTTRGISDANVNRALKDILGDPGTKKSPGWTYGVKSHCWPALAIAFLWSCKGDKSNFTP